MYQGKGIGRTLWTLIFIAIIGLIMVGCNQEEDLASEGEDDNEEEVVMEGEVERDDEKESEKESKDDVKELEKTESEDATGNSAIVEVTSQELQKITVEPYEIEERLILSGDRDYVLTEMPTAPGTVHIISEFEAWKKAYDEMDSSSGSKQPMYWYGSLLKDAWSDPEDYRGDRLENHPVDDDLFISSINYKEVSLDGKRILYSVSMYEEEGQHEGPESISGVFVTNFEIPVEPKELNISEGFFSIKPLWSESNEVIYYVLEDGLFSYSVAEDIEKLIIPSKDLPGIPREESDRGKQGVHYETYRDEESTYIYYYHDEKIMKITLGDEAEVETFYEGIDGEELENITVLKEDHLLLSYESGIFEKTELQLFNGEEIEIEKTRGTSQFQDHFISESGHVFLLFTTFEDGAEVQVFDQELSKEKSYRLPPSFSHSTVLGKVPGEPGELAVICDEAYYNLKTP
ncbi:hypothetical protein [Isachenkonia alkalipeptolytica]|uniref:Lipoprotein n=1 Tax=Isachenkonia alkalipeptolytica TaxID=2565777 RepID=A0AA43XJW3_9CLOT|nr:hypothetical protein [Isachenkonia alkalipeptolytica]NBG87706.1 hypothetical protein [Isachenkonia alkalipeptolytica]